MSFYTSKCHQLVHAIMYISAHLSEGLHLGTGGERASLICIILPGSHIATMKVKLRLIDVSSLHGMEIFGSMTQETFFS